MKRKSYVLISMVYSIFIALAFYFAIVYYFDYRLSEVNNTLNEFITSQEDSYIPIQEQHPLNLDDVDNEYLSYIAQVKGGSAEDRAYTILVTLNRRAELGYDIQQLVLFEVEEDIPSDFRCDYTTIEAMYMVTKENFDNSNGSLRYLR